MGGNMPKQFDAAAFNRQLRAAQQKAQREIDRVNRENKRVVDAHNRKVEQHNRKVVTDYNREVNRVNRHNAQAIATLNRQLRSASNGARYTPSEQALADRVSQSVPQRDEREWDIFLSYAKIDGSATAGSLRDALEALGVRVWFDEIAIVPGKSQALQMDRGLQKARAGLVLLTPAYLVGRFWTERELGALLNKETLIPVLHGVDFKQVKEYSGILPDLAGFETSRDDIGLIAEKIAAAIGDN